MQRVHVVDSTRLGGIVLLGTSVIWSAVIVASAAALRDTGYWSQVQPILGGGSIATLIVLAAARRVDRGRSRAEAGRPSWFHAEIVPAVATLLAGAATLGVILGFQNQWSVALPVTNAIGFSVLYAGIGLLLWASRHAKGAVGGLVSPAHDELVTTGPYRFVRHPIYVATTVAMIGAATVAQSLLGLAATLLLFVPVEVHRARLEERALERRFDERWRRYVSRVGAVLPRRLADGNTREV